MKIKHKLSSILTGFLLVFSIAVNFVIPSFAHSTTLDVYYDLCDENDKRWYYLQDIVCDHIDEETTTISYYFMPSNSSSYTWTTDVSESVANEIKTAYANSMKKWNNVNFYSYDTSGNVTKRKIINITEATSPETSNLLIYPYAGENPIALTEPAGTSEAQDVPSHLHYSDWTMNVYIHYFYAHDGITEAMATNARAKTGAHEIGHVLGLLDMDVKCTQDVEGHHSDLLMGYGDLETRQTNITYQDLAGVAITRGFHTDEDHRWLRKTGSANGINNLVCSICNGLKNVTDEDLADYSYLTYGICSSNHALSSGNMMAVASYGNTDYYKCKYCRYVAPFESNVTQNYTVTSYSDTQHKYTNNVNGLNYTFYEDHNMVNNACTVCNYVHTHSYTYTYVDGRTHSASCACGNTKMENHSVLASTIIDGRYAKCIGCKRLLDLNNDNAFIIRAIEKVSINGSYILESGVVVLVDEDVAAYLDGTLQFYDKDKLPVTE